MPLQVENPQSATSAPPATPSMGLDWIEPRRLLIVLLGISGLLGMAALPAAWLAFQRDIGEIDALPELARLFEINTESNIPTWFSSMLLVVAGVLAVHIGAHRRRHGLVFARHWTAMGLVLAFMSCDEISMFHEHIGENLHQAFGTTGVLRFAWVVPYGVAVAIVVACYLRFWLRLPPSTKRLLFVSAGLFVGGALGMELAEGFWTTEHGWGRGLRALTIIEEVMEMAGVSVLIYALASYANTVILASPCGAEHDPGATS